MAKTYYIVYTGVQRYRDGSVRPRTRVKKIRNVEGRPRVVGKKLRDGDLFVTIEALQVYTLRNGRKVKRKRVRDIHLGKAKRGTKVRVTTKPPKGPKIDRKRKRR